MSIQEWECFGYFGIYKKNQNEIHKIFAKAISVFGKNADVKYIIQHETVEFFFYSPHFELPMWLMNQIEPYANDGCITVISDHGMQRIYRYQTKQKEFVYLMQSTVAEKL